MRENWTDYEHPCFCDYDADPFSMTKEQFIAEAVNIEDCDENDEDTCNNKLDGVCWADCVYGRLSKHCDWLPKEE